MNAALLSYLSKVISAFCRMIAVLKPLLLAKTYARRKLCFF
jgi:hypothetical protein